MTKGTIQNMESLALLSLRWGWHPIMGMGFLLAPEVFIRSLAQLLQSMQVQLLVPVASTLASRSSDYESTFIYLAMNWLLMPAWGFTIFYQTRSRETNIQGVGHGLFLMCCAFFIGGLTFLFFAINYPVSALDVPMGRGFFLLKSLESSQFGLWFATSVVTGLCAVSTAAVFKITQWLLQRIKG